MLETLQMPFSNSPPFNSYEEFDHDTQIGRPDFIRGIQ